MRTRRTIITTLAALLLLFGAAACGDDDGGDEAVDDTTTTTTTEAAPPTSSAESVSDRLRAHLEAEEPELEGLIEGIGSVDLTVGEAQVTLTVGDEPADVDTGVAICEATLAFAEDAGFTVFEVEVENDENGGDEQLATGDLDGGCEAA